MRDARDDCDDRDDRDDCDARIVTIRESLFYAVTFETWIQIFRL